MEQMEGPGGGGAAVVYPDWFEHYLRTITGDRIQGVDESFKQQLTNDFMEETNIEKRSSSETVIEAGPGSPLLSDALGQY